MSEPKIPQEVVILQLRSEIRGLEASLRVYREAFAELDGLNTPHDGPLLPPHLSADGVEIDSLAAYDLARGRG